MTLENHKFYIILKNKYPPMNTKPNVYALLQCIVDWQLSQYLRVPPLTNVNINA